MNPVLLFAIVLLLALVVYMGYRYRSMNYSIVSFLNSAELPPSVGLDRALPKSVKVGDRVTISISKVDHRTPGAAALVKALDSYKTHIADIQGGRKTVVLADLPASISSSSYSTEVLEGSLSL